MSLRPNLPCLQSRKRRKFDADLSNLASIWPLAKSSTFGKQSKGVLLTWSVTYQESQECDPAILSESAWGLSSEMEFESVVFCSPPAWQSWKNRSVRVRWLRSGVSGMMGMYHNELFVEWWRRCQKHTHDHNGDISKVTVGAVVDKRWAEVNICKYISLYI